MPMDIYGPNTGPAGLYGLDAGEGRSGADHRNPDPEDKGLQQAPQPHTRPCWGSPIIYEPGIEGGRCQLEIYQQPG